MGLRINYNLEAFNAHRNLERTSGQLSKAMERLSSGLRINHASDDAAGLSISEKMRVQVSGLAQAQRNAQDGISLVQTAEGSLQEVTSILSRVRDLAVQFNNGVYDSDAKAAITSEVAQLSAELDNIISTSKFNGIALLSSSGPLATLQIGANNADTLAIDGVNAGTTIGSAVSDFVSASGTVDIDAIDTAITGVSGLRTTFGGVQNRLEHTINSLSAYQENLSAAESRIRDVDMAEEMSNYTRLQILQQSGTSMLAQANQMNSSVLSLLRG